MTAEQIRAELNAKLHWAAELHLALEDRQVPEGLRGALVDYLTKGICPGEFVQAVLANSLFHAIRAIPPEVDRTDLAMMLQFLSMHAPLPAWGSEKKVRAWVIPTMRDRLKVGLLEEASLLA